MDVGNEPERIRPAVAVRIGRRVRALRGDRGLTVVRLAELSDVSRRMLTQIELGQANPSLATIDKVAAALGTTLPGLLEVTDSPSPEGVQVWAGPAGSSAHLLNAMRTTAAAEVELWRWTLLPGDAYEIRPDAAGADSLLHVVRGRLTIDSADGPHVVDAGGSWRASGAASFTFRAPDGPVDLVRVVALRT
ncbi:helix-turn-helix domain-containing protein [Nocardioides sp. CFH 31398]|uniref:helix-turn-helix domain-containing protein n=1 Tax=Nocardioides sp. CFH 31398 TaxID=2919579 RepID=UPI001F059A2B|nr:helix-turn-helix domain-containing protein [Nocardioides sp. CFH 31398]MCH1867005.1 helix-turn-helix domain-containing protein [Nocardioides sp. CFH 31398]